MAMGRRSFLIGGGAGVGLLVAWTLWPRDYAPALNLAPGEHVFGGYVKIGEDGHVSVVVPQAEMGQGVYTALPQILADELGADWRTVAVEPAAPSPAYANRLFAREQADVELPRWLDVPSDWAADERAMSLPLMITAGSTSVRNFAVPLREAGARARALLSMAAAKRWGIDWGACDTDAGFVVRGPDRLRFGELAADAAAMTAPSDVALRAAETRRLAGQPLPRLDLAAKIDGSAEFAGDVRLPDMVFASIRQAPIGAGPLVVTDKGAAARIPGMIAVVENPRWVATLAQSWWPADRALDALVPRFASMGALADDAAIAAALDRAMSGDGARIAGRGSVPDPIPNAVAADYAVGFAAHATIEPLVATARVGDDMIEVWAPTQAPTAMRHAVASALGRAERHVTIYPMLGGGGFGRKLEIDAAVQAALLARQAARPVQLMWSRPEECAQGAMRPPARARMEASLDGAGRIATWHARIAAPESSAETLTRLFGAMPLGGRGRAVAGALSAYDIQALAITHHRAELGVPTGIWRSEAHSYTAFFTESFVDELAAKAGADPLAFRLRMLDGAPRLAACLKMLSTRGGWQGGRHGVAQGIACHAAFGSFIALLAEARIAPDQSVKVDRVYAAVDCGEVINPDLVLQQIEGGIVFAMGAALGTEPGYADGLANPRKLGGLGLPALADCPEIQLELVPSGEPPGGVSELAVPPLAPAIANALFAASGQRYRRLPIRIGT